MCETGYKRLYSTGEVARMLSVSQSTVINYIERGILVPDQVLPSSNGKSGRRKFYQETVDAFKGRLEIGKETV